MSAIQQLPDSKSFGLGFNYSTWTAGTAITLCNVRWNSDYRDIVEFDNQAQLDDYLKLNSGPVIDITRLSYAKFGRPIRIDTPYNVVQNYNYIRAYNPAQPVNGDVGRAFYYFITDINYVNPNCTEIFVQVDVWQTFGFGITFGNCYIERGHLGIANQSGFANFGRDYLTVPEGLDLGGEYMIVDQWERSIGSARDGMHEFGYSIMMTTTVSLESDPGTVKEPNLTTATGSTLENLPNGAETWFFGGPASLKAFLTAMKDKPWVTQGIVSLMAIPHWSVYGISEGLIPVQIAGVTVYKVPEIKRLNNVLTPLKANWRDSVVLPDRYRNLLKFKTSPYMMLEMTSYTGTPLSIKPESWTDRDANVLEIPHFAPPSARVMFVPYRYNASPTSTAATTDNYGVINDGGEFLDMATGIFDFPTFSVVNNSYMQFMASNRNGIAFQHSSADWSQQKALRGNSVSYDQASAGINLSKDLNAQQIAAANQGTAIANTAAGYQAIRSGIGAVGSAGNGPGGMLNAASGLANAGVDYALTTGQNNANLANQNQLSQGQNRASNDTAGYMRDTNKGLADWSANGDYENQIAGINAKVQDAKMIQPTTSGQVGGDAFNLATYKWGYDVKVKMIQPAAMNAIGDYWLRYGYAINRFGKMPASLMVMEKFTYWKLKETYITAASCPEAFKQAIRGIFEKGVTVWKNPMDIGSIDIADNDPLEGVTF